MTGPLMVPRIQRNKDHRGATIEPSSPAAESPILLLNLDRRRLRRFDLGFLYLTPTYTGGESRRQVRPMPCASSSCAYRLPRDENEIVPGQRLVLERFYAEYDAQISLF